MNRVVACILMLVLVGCDQGGNDQVLKIQDGSGGYIQKSKIMVGDSAQLKFINSSYFDGELSGTMEAKPRRIRVAILSGFRVDGRVPQRIDKWLYAIQNSGGRVSAIQDPPPPRTRDLTTMLINVAVHTWDVFAERRMYSPAKSYDATLLYGEDKIVKEILFKQR